MVAMQTAAFRSSCYQQSLMLMLFGFPACGYCFLLDFLLSSVLAFHPSRILMDIIRLPPEERVLHAVCLVHCPLLTEASSLLRCLAVPGPS